MPPRPVSTLFRAIAPRCQATSRRRGIPAAPAESANSAPDPRRARLGCGARVRLISPPFVTDGNEPGAAASSTLFYATRRLSTTHPKKYSHEGSSGQILARRLSEPAFEFNHGFTRNGLAVPFASAPDNGNLRSVTQKWIGLMLAKRHPPAAAATSLRCLRPACWPVWHCRRSAVQNRKLATGPAPNRRRRPWS